MFALSLVLVLVTCSSGNKQQGGTGGSGSGGTGTGTGGQSTGAGGISNPTGGTYVISGAGGTGNVISGGGGTGNVISGGGGMGNAGGQPGTGGAPARSFPTQACLDKASALVAMMTADQKAAQLHQIERANATTSDITNYDVGSIYSQGGSAPSTNTPTGWADMIDGFRKASFASTQKIPIIYGLDVVHGVGPVIGATVFPHNIGLGATRDLALVEQVGSTVADEAAGVGADFPFAPVVAVARDERWGRTYESFGEDPTLVSQMGVAYINGFQKRSGSFTVLANAKHYLGDGGTANGVNEGNTSGDETTLRSIHLTPYQYAVSAGVGSIMASYSSWQGVAMHQNTTMITSVLKGMLNFQGFVGSDYNGCTQLGVTLGSCLNAGVDMVMTYPTSASSFVSSVKALVPGTVPQSRIDDAARRILVVKCEMGLLDGSMRLVDRSLTSQVGSAAHRAVARKAVSESLVLLKNDGNVLPLPKSAVVSLGGKTADDIGNQCGGWTVSWQGASGNTTTGGTTIRQALQSVVPTVNYALDGSATGNGSTVGIAVIGETPYSEGCGDIPNPMGGTLCTNRPTTLEVDSSDVAVVQKMKSAGLKVVVVLVAGRPLMLDQILPMADAIVMAWLPGTEGAGVTDVLFGDVHPSGTLPRTWPSSMSQIPINVGDANYNPQYPFGYGLTY
ncbi:MAG TPA: glycoside hydrolase family 3 N-terminal domain-containing protein [Polyangia bacterium]|nr:glycoside hydrolase family 3 N-terminal domain-containing protein [Polyangia bacterium]